MGYGVDCLHPRLYRFVLWAIGGNYKYAVQVLNSRLKLLPVEARRTLSSGVWQGGGAIGWSQRAFENPENRCQQYVYTAVRDLYQRLARPLRILELGCTNGGSLHCLLYRGVEISGFTGVDISRPLISEASERFSDRKRFQFHCGDFLEYCSTTNDRFDVLLVKLTLMFLDQAYLEMLFQLIGQKVIADRIVVSEKQHASHKDENSTFGDWGNAPQDYSHNYLAQFEKAGYVLESGGLVRLQEDASLYVFRAVLARTN